MRMKKTLFQFGLFFCVWGAVGLGRAVVDRIVAVVNQEVITLSEVESRSGSPKDEEEETDRLARKQRDDENRRKALDQIIEEKLIDQEIKRTGIKIAGKEVDAAVDEIRRRNNVSEEQFEAALAREGFNPESFRKQIEKRLLRIRLIQRVVKTEHSAGEKELREFYQKNLERYRSRDAYRASHILFHLPKDPSHEDIQKARKKCQSVLEKLGAGADFAEMATLYSEDASAKDGGDIGLFRRGELVPAFENEALRLKAGEVSGIVRSPFGFHIIKLTERKSGIPSFDEIRARVESDYYEKESETAFNKYLSTLREKAIIEIKL